MNYYEVCLLAKNSKLFGGVATYQSQQVIEQGSFVTASYRNRRVTGYIKQAVTKPKYATKPIASVLDEPPLQPELQNLAEWMSAYYSVDLPTVLRTILPAGIEKSRRKPSASASEKKRTQKNIIELSTEQKKVANKAFSSVKPVLLQGVTGSGKTHVYIDLIHKTLAKGQDVIVLVPEILLSQQLVDRISEFVPSVHQVHSEQTESERHIIWSAIAKATQPVVVIGPRSAVFSPVKNLGLIVIDEAHDQSFAQDTKPSYNALFVAGKRSQINSSKLILGSATPNVTEKYFAQAGLMEHLVMPGKHHVQDNHKKHVIDLRNRALFKSNDYISDELLASIEESLASHKQSLVFINRRGYAPTIACSSCEWRATCPDCETFVTLHQPHTLRCHTCGWKSENVITSCPECKKPTVHYGGVGTQKIVHILKQRFPKATIARLDQDSSENASINASDQSNHDIFVGTQMITKGFDLERLQTVGIINADSMLFLPDFRANERAFQVLTQVIGRNDRRGLGGNTYIQTSAPGSATIAFSLNEDYSQFYEYELPARKQFNYPPFTYLGKFTARRKTDAQAQRVLLELKEYVATNYPELTCLGPTPSFHHSAIHRSWNLVIKCKKRSVLQQIALHAEEKNIIVNLDPLDLL